MELKLCPNCQKPYLADKPFCPHCPPPAQPYTWDQESWANAGCFIIMMLFVLLAILIPLFWFFVMVFSRL
jgi:hypothetical protein